MNGPQETFRRLRALAERPGATESERETARAIMARYVERYGSEAFPADEPITEQTVVFSTKHEKMLALHCALFMELKASELGRWRGKKFVGDGFSLCLSGQTTAVECAVALYEHHRERLRRLLELTENGYRHGAMPLPNATHASGKARELTPEELAALRAAGSAGRASQLQKHLEGGK